MTGPASRTIAGGTACFGCFALTMRERIDRACLVPRLFSTASAHDGVNALRLVRSRGTTVMANFWARKSITVLEVEAQERDVQTLTTHDGVALKRTLSAANLVNLGIGAIIGAGIFVLTGHAAAANAGPAITLSFALGAVACCFAGLCYAEMASTVPIAGSAYTYAYATMGEFIAWIIGWDLILEYALGATTVAIGWSGYVVSFLKDFGIVIPPAFAGSPLAFDATEHAWTTTGALINVPAMLIIA